MSKLTQRTIDNRNRPQKGQEILRDDDLPGFGVRFTVNSASYVVEGRLKGRNARRTIGRADLISLDEARSQARQLLGMMGSGVDPTNQKKQDRFAAITLAEVLETYLATKELKPGTVDVYRRMTKHAFRDWLDKPVTAITRDMVSDRHREMANGACRGGSSGKAYANGCFKTLQALLNFAAEKYEVDGQPLFPTNPVSRLTKTRAWYRVHPRTGVVPEYKLAAWYRTVALLKNKAVSDYLLLLLFTGIRRREGTNLKWADIDFEAKTLTVRREQAKNHRDHVLPLSTFLLDLLNQRYQNRSESPYVFPGRHNRGHLTQFRMWQLEVRAKSGCNFMIHDLRRGFLSAAERLELPYYVLKKLANHKTSPADTLVSYIQVSQERLRAHMERISQHFLDLFGARSEEAVG